MGGEREVRACRDRATRQHFTCGNNYKLLMHHETKWLLVPRIQKGRGNWETAPRSTALLPNHCMPPVAWYILNIL